MQINFDEIRQSGNISNEVLLNLMEKIYEETMAKSTGFLKMNEYIKSPTKVTGKSNTYSFELAYAPASAADISIVTTKNTVLAPSTIISVDEKTVTVMTSSISTDIGLFVTYKA